MYRPSKKDWDYEAVAALQAAGENVVAKAKGKPAMERPNWSLLIVGIGPYPTEPCQKIVRRFKDMGHRIVHASLVLDGSRSEKIELQSVAGQTLDKTG